METVRDDKIYTVTDLEAIRLQLLASNCYKKSESLGRIKVLLKYSRLGTKIKAVPGSDLFKILNRLFHAINFQDSEENLETA